MMIVLKTLQTALRALRRNVMRSALTCVGIVIGIAAVIAMMEIGNGVSTLNARAIASLGANNLIVYPGQAASGGVSFGAGSMLTLTPEDCEAIIEECPSVRAAAPVVRSNGQVVYGNTNYVPMSVYGTTPEYLNVREWAVDEGASFTDQDVRNKSKVCLIGQTIVESLFGEEDPVGKDIRLSNVGLRVVGVLARKGASMFGTDQDDVIILPWTTVKDRISGKTSSISSATGSSASTGSSTAMNSLSNLYPSGAIQLYPQMTDIQIADNPMPVRQVNVSEIMTAADSSADIPVAIKEMSALLRERHNLRNKSDDFQIRDMTELMSTMASTTERIGNLLLIVAAISLVVGGVGIMNIMLVSVTERTREIGLRMAVGAEGIHILFQFLIEAIVLCLAGGIVGILLGRGCSYLVRTFMQWPTAVSVPAIIVSVVVSAMIGIVFGFYPAWKASRLDPIDALRYE